MAAAGSFPGACLRPWPAALILAPMSGLLPARL
jgi:hypothetical protein